MLLAVVSSRETAFNLVQHFISPDTSSRTNSYRHKLLAELEACPQIPSLTLVFYSRGYEQILRDQTTPRLQSS